MAARLGMQDACDCRETAATTEVSGIALRLTQYLRPRALAGLAAGLMLCAAGPLMAQEAAKEEGPLKPDLKAGQETVEEVCAACHGADGNSQIPQNPKLAGQHAEYIRKQLKDFAPGEGDKPAARVNAVMGAFASQLTPQDVVNVAAFFASQKLEPTAAHNAESMELGRNIYRGGIPGKGVPACAACHGGFTDNGKNNIFCGNARRHFAAHFNFHAFRTGLF